MLIAVKRAVDAVTLGILYSLCCVSVTRNYLFCKELVPPPPPPR
jgi:hypothetical protein